MEYHNITNYITIVGFGDSITQAVVRMSDADKRWLNILARKLTETFPYIKFNVINSGVGGNSAREAMQRFDCDVLAHNPDFVLLEFGGNNSDFNNPERQVSLEEFSGYLMDFKRRLPPKTQVIVITFPPVMDDQTASRNHPKVKAGGGSDALVNGYREVTRQFAAQNLLPLVDLDRELKKLMSAAAKNHYTIDDGVHLTAAGNAVLAALVFDTLRLQIQLQCFGTKNRP